QVRRRSLSPYTTLFRLQLRAEPAGVVDWRRLQARVAEVEHPAAHVRSVRRTLTSPAWKPRSLPSSSRNRSAPSSASPSTTPDHRDRKSTRLNSSHVKSS